MARSLFDQPATIDASFSIRDEIQQNRQDIEETIQITQVLWDLLVGPQASDEQRLLVSVSCSVALPKRHGANSLKSVTCWATKADTEQTADLTISRTWLSLYPAVFPRSFASSFSVAPRKNPLQISLSEPICLTQVVVSALSQEAYDAASGSSGFSSWFSDEKPVIRQGATYCIPVPKPTINGHLPDDIHHEQGFHRYMVQMTEPVLQGCIERETTQILLLLSLEPSSEVDDSALHNSSHVGDSLEEDLEIDETFLANSVLVPPVPEVQGSSFTKLSEGNAVSNTSSISIEPLEGVVDAIEDDWTVYIRTADLSRVGLLDGDWAVIQSMGSLRRRLVKVKANDDVVSDLGIVTCSPVLTSNIADVLSPSIPSPIAVTLVITPFGASRPAIPTAQSITVARISSPIASNRAYQNLFLGGLKKYFGETNRLVKKGDLICISIATGETREWLHSDKDDEASIVEDVPLDAGPANAVVFFTITNVEHNLVKADSAVSANDIHSASMLGELGCWVDANVTRIVQTGVEHALVPDVAGYLSIDDKVIPEQSAASSQTNYDKLVDLASAALIKGAEDYHLNLSALLKGSRGVGKFTTIAWVARRLGLHILEVNCYDLIGDNNTQTEGTLRARFDKASSCSPCILVLRHIDALAQTTQVLENGKEPALVGALRECISDTQKTWHLTGFPVLVFGTTSQADKVPAGLLACFKHEFTFEVPDERSRREILNNLTTGYNISPDVSLASLATETAALVASDLVDLVARAVLAAQERIHKALPAVSAQTLATVGISLTASDFDFALGKARSSYSESIGAPKIPNVSWDDVGGLAHVKADILDTVQLPLEHPELFADGLKQRSGILLYGPPGTGKTLLAKAVATSCNLNFFSVKGPELLNMYIGESEANVRRVFQRARDAKPCVIFFDELDSVAPKRGNHGDSGGVMDRIVSQLLAELDGMSSGGGSTDVFVIGATNRPDLLDGALLRPGRFDRMLYLGVSDTHEAQLNILEALTRKFKLDPDLSLASVAQQCPFNYTGADFYALCSDAMLNAMTRKAEETEARIAELNKSGGVSGHPYPLTPQYYLAEIATPEEIAVLVSQTDFDIALRNLVPSVSPAEMEHYAQVQRRFSQPESAN